MTVYDEEGDDERHTRGAWLIFGRLWLGLVDDDELQTCSYLLIRCFQVPISRAIIDSFRTIFRITIKEHSY
jgi:hypothetical protein